MARVDYTNIRKTRHTLKANLILFVVAVLFCLPSILPAEETQTGTAPSGSIILPEKGASEDMVFKEFRVRVKELLAQEAMLIEANEKSTKDLEILMGLRQKRCNPEFKKARKELKKELNRLEDKAEAFKSNWRELNLPDKKLRILKDTKLIRLSTFGLHIKDKKRIIDTWDPTDIEYAKEHLKQSQLFEEKFKKVLSANPTLTETGTQKEN